MSQAGQINSAAGPVPPAVPTSFVTNDGTAIPAANILNVLGGSGVETYADPNLSNNLYIKIQNSVTDTGQTINAQTITLSTFDCSVPGTYFFTTQLAAYTATGPAGVGGELYTTVISDGVTATVLGDTDAISHISMSITDVDYVISTSGLNAELQVTGAVGFTINWGAITIYVFRGL